MGFCGWSTRSRLPCQNPCFCLESSIFSCFIFFSNKGWCPLGMVVSAFYKLSILSVTICVISYVKLYTQGVFVCFVSIWPWLCIVGFSKSPFFLVCGTQVLYYRLSGILLVLTNLFVPLADFTSYPSLCKAGAICYTFSLFENNWSEQI